MEWLELRHFITRDAQTLTDALIQDTKAGTKLDVLVAIHVLGWKVGRSYGNGNGDWKFPEGTTGNLRRDWHGTPRFSTELEAAWRVLGWLKEQWGEVYLEWEADGWNCNNGDEYSRNYPALFYGFGSTAPAAICHVALLYAKQLQLINS